MSSAYGPESAHTSYLTASFDDSANHSETPAMSEDRAMRDPFLVANELLAAANSGCSVQCWDDFSPSVFILILESIVGEYIPSIRRQPVGIDDALHNSMVLLSTMERLLGQKISGITPQDLVDRYPPAITVLVSLLDTIAQLVDEELGVPASISQDNSRLDPIPPPRLEPLPPRPTQRSRDRVASEVYYAANHSRPPSAHSHSEKENQGPAASAYIVRSRSETRAPAPEPLRASSLNTGRMSTPPRARRAGSVQVRVADPDSGFWVEPGKTALAGRRPVFNAPGTCGYTSQSVPRSLRASVDRLTYGGKDLRASNYEAPRDAKAAIQAEISRLEAAIAAPVALTEGQKRVNMARERIAAEQGAENYRMRAKIMADKRRWRMEQRLRRAMDLERRNLVDEMKWRRDIIDSERELRRRQEEAAETRVQNEIDMQRERLEELRVRAQQRRAETKEVLAQAQRAIRDQQRERLDALKAKLAQMEERAQYVETEDGAARFNEQMATRLKQLPAFYDVRRAV